MTVVWPMLLLLMASSLGASDASADLLAIKAQNQSLYWGTYRPNLYFGTRTRAADTNLLTGLIWFGAKDLESGKWSKFRHNCDQGDDLRYAWDEHDGRRYGRQTIEDKLNNVVLTTEFVKIPGDHGGHWAVRVSGKPMTEGENPVISLIYYVGLDKEGSLSEAQSDSKTSGSIRGDSPEVGNFVVTWREEGNNDSPTGLVKGSLRVPEGEVWRAKDHFYENILSNAQQNHGQWGGRSSPAALLLAGSPGSELKNLHFFQKAFSGEFQFDILFESGEEGPLSGTKLSEVFARASKSFDERFEQTFGLKSKGYNEDQIVFAKMLLGNLIGGTGQFHGTSIVDRALEGHEEFEPVDYIEEKTEEKADDYFGEDSGEVISPDSSMKPNPQLEGPYTLFSAVPSRPFFPRGFLWDEGFHQMLISAWDSSLSLEMLDSWTSLVDDNGWIAREQILGDEARSRVPAEFQTQYPHFANPPTLVLPLLSLVTKMINFDIKLQQQSDSITAFENLDYLKDMYFHNSGLGKSKLKKIYAKLQKQYSWFRRTQWGDIDGYGRGVWNVSEGYRWRGRKGYHTLTSGLDDYPRSPEPHPGELHLDLISWVGLYSKLLAELSQILDEPKNAERYQRHHTAILKAIDVIHWNPETNTYCDISVDKSEKTIKICHNGYVSLFPMILGLLSPESKRLKATIDLIKNPQELWTSHGVLSLSQSDKYFGTGENYWRGPIWINVNFLILKSLKTYSEMPGPYKELCASTYRELRENVVNTVYSEYKRTGFPWEQYSPDGEGKRSHPFTGWTALVTLIMAEKF